MNVEAVMDRLAELDQEKPVMFAEYPKGGDYTQMEVIVEGYSRINLPVSALAPLVRQ